MEFFEYQTTYDDYIALAKDRKNDKLLSMESDKWHEMVLRTRVFNELFGNDPAKQGTQIACLAGERTWISLGRPYYKVYPQMASMMSEVSIDIPIEALRMPYPVFSIHLANSPENDMHDEGGPRLKSIMVFELTCKRIDQHNYEVGVGVMHPGLNKRDMNTDVNNDELVAALGKGASLTLLSSGADRALYINYIFEGSWRGHPNSYNYTLSLCEEGTIEEFFENSYEKSLEQMSKLNEPGEYCPSKEMIRRILKLTVATAFFGIDQHEMVMPDLPRKKLQRRIQRASSLAELSEELKRDRAHLKKWTIGREISLPRPILDTVKVESNEIRSLTHGYLRRGHMRYQVCGEGRKMRKLIFIHPQHVRPDLPLAQHGFRIDDENARILENQTP